MGDFSKQARCCAIALSLAFVAACSGGGGGGSDGGGNPSTNISNTYDVPWGTAVRLADINSGASRDPDLVADPYGNFVVMWEQSILGLEYALWTARYEAGTGWKPAEAIISSSSRSIDTPRLYAHPNGDITGIWLHSTSNEPYDVWTSHYSANGSWSARAKLNDVVHDYPCFAGSIDNTGNVTAIWPEAPFATAGKLIARRYSPVSGWSLSEDVGFADMFVMPNTCKSAVDGAGNVTAIWVSTFSQATESLWARRFVPGTGWDAGRELQFGDFGVWTNFISTDPAGNVTVAWTEETSFTPGQSLWVTRYDAINGWLTNIEYMNVPDGIIITSLEADALGNVVLTWTQSESSGFFSLWAGYYDAISGWGTPRRLIQERGQRLDGSMVATSDRFGNHTLSWRRPRDGGGVITEAVRYETGQGWRPVKFLSSDNAKFQQSYKGSIIADHEGNVTVAWSQYNGTDIRAWAHRYEPARGWSNAARLDTVPHGDTGDIKLAVDANGNVMAVWQHVNGGGWGVWASMLPGSQ